MSGSTCSHTTLCSSHGQTIPLTWTAIASEESLPCSLASQTGQKWNLEFNSVANLYVPSLFACSNNSVLRPVTLRSTSHWKKATRHNPNVLWCMHCLPKYSCCFLYSRLSWNLRLLTVLVRNLLRLSFLNCSRKQNHTIWSNKTTVGRMQHGAIRLALKMGQKHPRNPFWTTQNRWGPTGAGPISFLFGILRNCMLLVVQQPAICSVARIKYWWLPSSVRTSYSTVSIGA